MFCKKRKTFVIATLIHFVLTFFFFQSKRYRKILKDNLEAKQKILTNSSFFESDSDVDFEDCELQDFDDAQEEMESGNIGKSCVCFYS